MNPLHKNISAQDKIITAAIQEFSEKGYSGARMQAIAEKAGVNKALLHYYFRSKEKLYETIMEQCVHHFWGEIADELDACQGEMPLKDIIELIATTFINHMSKEPNYYKLVFRELISGNKCIEKMEQSVWPVIERGPLRVIHILQEQMDKGYIKKISPIHIMLNINGMCAYTFLGYPYLESLNRQNITHIDLNEAYFKERIQSIVEMAYSGIITKEK
jgi:TetR/AcrR family transcriptional regulator